jgi:hypothetical protein
MGIWDRVKRRFQRAAPANEPIPVQQKVRPTYIEEIKEGGIAGAFGLDQVNWGLSIGPIWQVWQTAPCMGDPVTFDDCVKCCATWYCCCPCAFTKLYASSLKQPCALVPHTVLALFCPLCGLAFTRYNLRFLNDVEGNLMGDFVCSFACFLCAHCQHLRASKIEDWSVGKLECPVPIVPTVKVLQ